MLSTLPTRTLRTQGDVTALSQGQGWLSQSKLFPRDRDQAAPHTWVIVTPAFKRIICLSPISIQKVMDKKTKTIKEKSSSQALTSLLCQFTIQTHFPRDKLCYPSLAKQGNSSCPYSIPLPSAPLCKARVDRRGKGGLHNSQKTSVFSCPDGRC